MVTPILAALTKILLIQIVIKQTFSAKVDKKRVVALFAAFALACAFSIAFVDKLPANEAVSATGVLFALFSPLFAFKEIQKSQSFFLSTLALGLITAIVMIARWILYIASASAIDNTESTVIDVISNSALLSFCILTARRRLLAKLFYNTTLLRRHMKVLLLFTVWVSAMIASLFYFFFGTYYGEPGFALIGALTAALIVLVGIMCPLLIVKNLSSSYYENLARLMDKQVQAHVAHYEAMSAMTEDIRKFRHDYGNLRVGLVNALGRNDVPGALALLNADEMKPHKPAYHFATGNVVLDALLYDKMLIAEEANAEIVFDGAVPGHLLNPADTCIIFGNALDNAIEACAKLTGADKNNRSKCEIQPWAPVH
jgi:membrane associated rhomboid family serine protease